MNEGRGLSRPRFFLAPATPRTRSVPAYNNSRARVEGARGDPMPMRLQLLIPAAVAIALAAGSATVAVGADTSATTGRDIAASCANCHGTDGRSRGTIASIAGQDKAYLVQQLKDFRDGKRPSTIMQQLAKGYTDEQIEAAAAYLASRKPN